MHWEAHEFALPALKKQMKWYQVAGTEEMPDEAECLKEQKMIEVKARTIILLQGR
jgi:isoamylase